MSSLAAQFGYGASSHPLCLAFLKWQCHTRQLAMRQNQGRPDDAITPDVYLPGEAESMGSIITVMNKSPAFSVTPELEHMAAKTNDPAQRRENAIQFLSSAYYQKAKEFSDILTATFPPASASAKKLHQEQRARLVFECYGQRFDLDCKVWRLAPHNLLHKATIAHNALFNASIPPGTEVLGFEPDWEKSSSEPPLR